MLTVNGLGRGITSLVHKLKTVFNICTDDILYCRLRPGSKARATTCVVLLVYKIYTGVWGLKIMTL